MNEDEIWKQLQLLHQQLGANTKNGDGSKHKKILCEIKRLENELKKIKPSTSGEGPDPKSILPQWSVSRKRVRTMVIEKREKRRPGGGSNIDPWGT